MRRTRAFIAAVLLVAALPVSGFANDTAVQAPGKSSCTVTGTIGAAVSTQIVGFNDLQLNPPGRHYMFVQNTGTNPMNVAVGSGNNATATDLTLDVAASWVLGPTTGGQLLPSGDVAVYSALGTSYAFCDF